MNKLLWISSLALAVGVLSSVGQSAHAQCGCGPSWHSSPVYYGSYNYVPRTYAAGYARYGSYGISGLPASYRSLGYTRSLGYGSYYGSPSWGVGRSAYYGGYGGSLPYGMGGYPYGVGGWGGGYPYGLNRGPGLIIGLGY